MKALVFGLSGQDGSYIADILLDKGYEVHGTHRKSSNPDNLWRCQQLDRITLHKCDLTDSATVERVIHDVRPDEIYNEADQDHVGWSYVMPDYSMNVTALGPLRIFEAALNSAPEARIFQPCSSHMFGQTDHSPQNEDTPFNPISPYGCAKVCAYYLARYYREVHGLAISTGILYNHESPRRSPEYVTRKITLAAARKERVKLGNINARIDWGYAKDYMRAAWMMLQHEPDDFVIATGKTHTVRNILELTYGANWKDWVQFDETLVRPSDTGVLVGDTSKARTKLGWEPTVSFEELIAMMYRDDERNT